MSFGFSVGDFIAAGLLAERLYKEIYLVARHASQELQQVQNEVARRESLMKTNQLTRRFGMRPEPRARCLWIRLDVVRNLGSVAVRFEVTSALD